MASIKVKFRPSTNEIYLASLENYVVDKANAHILKDS